MEDVQLVQLSPNRVAITFNKKALAKLREGGSAGVSLKFASKELKFLFMRDVEFNAKFAEFRRTSVMEQKSLPWWKRWFLTPFMKVRKLSPLGKHRKVEK